MSPSKSSKPRPINVFVRSGSKAELVSRRRAAREKVAAKPKYPEADAIAHGFHPHPELNLRDNGGQIIGDLVFTNFFVGGSGSWDPQDIKNIDTNLSAAMSDQGLNNVLIQYFRGAANITSTFKPSTILPGAPPASISQQDVEALVTSLTNGGKLSGFDFSKTVFNFMLPRGVVLTIDDGSGDEAPHHKKGDTDEAASSLEGLGGFHGSVHVAGKVVFYAVGVFSDGDNGIVAFDQPWKNVVATFYHELVEARTDAGVEDDKVAWVNNERPSEEIGDIPMTLAGANLGKVMKEVPLANGAGTVPIQLMWSNAVAGPEGPIAKAHQAAAS
jgi:hypothetical protein